MGLEEAIKCLIKFCEYEDNVVLVDNALCVYQKAIETVLKELEKYKTEYEAFRNGEKFTAKQMKFIEKEYMPKKKIEKKIKEKELILQTGNAETSDDRIHLEGEIFSLQKLLEDK